MSNLESSDPSRDQTPNPGGDRFQSSSAGFADALVSQTAGLVSLSEYRKRRREAVEINESATSSAVPSGVNTPRDGGSAPLPVDTKKKKKKKAPAKAKLSFGLNEDDDDDEGTSASAARTPRSLSQTPDIREGDEGNDGGIMTSKRKLGARSDVAFVPKIRTKATLEQEAEKTEQLRKEFLATREAVKKTDIMIPFVFYDGAITGNGKVKVRKGDNVWLFLDKARKMGAELGVGGERASSNWARVSVDDLMMVRDEIILPQHYEFYYFAANKVRGYSGPLATFSADQTAASPAFASNEEEDIDPATYDPLSKPTKRKDPARSHIADEQLEGFYDDPTQTKLVDRRWYEKHKHIYPASVWQEFDPTKDYSSAKRTDAQGNAFFLS